MAASKLLDCRCLPKRVFSAAAAARPVAGKNEEFGKSGMLTVRIMKSLHYWDRTTRGFLYSGIAFGCRIVRLACSFHRYASGKELNRII